MLRTVGFRLAFQVLSDLGKGFGCIVHEVNFRRNTHSSPQYPGCERLKALIMIVA